MTAPETEWALMDAWVALHLSLVFRRATRPHPQCRREMARAYRQFARRFPPLAHLALEEARRCEAEAWAMQAAAQDDPTPADQL